MTEANYQLECLLDKNFGNVVIIDNIPVVSNKKYDKLTKVLRKLFSKYGEIITEDDYNGLYIPTVERKGKIKTAGYAMVEYETREMAKKAVKEGDLKELDKKHILRFNFFTDYEKYMNISDTFEEPKKRPFEPKENLTDWLLDPYFRDQYVVRYASETQVYWNDPIRENENDGRLLQYGGERQKENNKTWTDGYVEWSPKGSFLVTHHNRGIALWGGDHFKKLARFSHDNVKVIAFSPNEKYLITCNGQAKVDAKDPPCLIVWEVNNSTILRPFDTCIRPQDWPVFHWSHDDKYLARVQVLESTKGDKKKREVISVYVLPEMRLLNKRSLDVPGVQQVMWSPSENILSYWVPERDDIPARVGLMEIPSKRRLREMHIYSVESINMHWQNAGDYLCIKIERKKTRKQAKGTNFEIVRMRSKEYPVEVLENFKNQVIAFCWEPNGHRFAIIHGDGNTPDVSFYTLRKRKVTLLKILKEKRANSLYWKGNTIILAGLGAMNGSLTFIETTTFQEMAEVEHFMCNDVEWDASGRYAITSVCAPLGGNDQWRYSMESGYKVWNTEGQCVAQIRFPSGEKCYRVAWRPRPKTLLSKAEIRDIKKNLKEKYWKKFEHEDQTIREQASSVEEKGRLRMKSKWKAYREERRNQYKQEAILRQELRRGVRSDDEDNWETAEEVIEEEIEARVLDG